ncbi:MAG: hypothetical protein WCQ72_04065 [Eubacteriales bacterium]
MDSTALPRRIYVGGMQTSHVQGICIDTARKYMYFSFTTVLVKTDLDGNVVGSCGGLTGHLGDIDFNDYDGRVYGSLEYKAASAFYCAIFDAGRIDRVGMDAERDGIMTTVYLTDVAADFTADMNGDGIFDGNTADTPDHRYGCSGIDGTSFGPAFGNVSGDAARDTTDRLMIAYGIYGNTGRADNDYQVIGQYDYRDFKRYERPLTQSAPHKSGPAAPEKKYFLFTGNTVYGVQNLEYDAYTKSWFAAVYTGQKQQYPNYPLFRIQSGAPVSGKLLGQEGDADAQLLSLAEGAEHDGDLTGYRFPYGQTGLIALDDGYYYISKNGKKADGQYSDVTLWRWNGHDPFERV